MPAREYEDIMLHDDTVFGARVRDREAFPPAQISAGELEPWLRAHVGNYVVLHTDGARACGRVISSICEDGASHLAHDSVDHTAQ